MPPLTASRASYQIRAFCTCLIPAGILEPAMLSHSSLKSAIHTTCPSPTTSGSRTPFSLGVMYVRICLSRLPNIVRVRDGPGTFVAFFLELGALSENAAWCCPVAPKSTPVELVFLGTVSSVQTCPPEWMTKTLKGQRSTGCPAKLLPCT